MSNKNNIEAPYIGLEKWRKDHVPAIVWDEEHLVAYRKTRNALDAIAITIVVLAAVASGMMLELSLIFPK